jgi:hypothetical protein
MTTMANPISEQPERTTGRSSSITPGTYWAWVGAHGGAGVTTLSQAIPGGVDLGRRLPVEEGLTDLPAVVVCRGNAGGLIAARDTAAMAHASTRLLGLVVVADIPERRRPKVLAESLYLTRGAFNDHVWEMPWVEAWRLGENPSPTNNPREIRDLLRTLWTAVNLPLPGGPNQRRS